MIGRVFNRLTVLRAVEQSVKTHRYYECLCTCGNTKVIRGSRLLEGKSASCGCLRQELVSKRNSERSIKHSQFGTTEYNIWYSMKARCYNKNHVGYKYYGAKGITICEEWIESFDTFYADMGARPSDNHSIDRIDNSKGYSPNNCKWSSREEQANNKTNITLYVYQDSKQSIKQWSRTLNIQYDKLKRRVYKYDGDFTKAVETIIGKNNE